MFLLVLDCMLDSSFPELITIEDNVVVSFRVMVICHDDAKGLMRTDSGRNDMSVAPVILKKGCYIGAGAIILPGIIIGENSVVGAGAVVTKDVESNTLVTGIPAKFQKHI
jgi:acetyltransferase-like isoleucine patch superfamily enzyme